MEQLTSSLVDWLKEKAAGAKGAVFGMSGGIDSSVVAALCQRAFPGQALGVLIPCHSIPEDMEHARLVAVRFGVPTRTVDIGAVYDALYGALVPALPEADGDAGRPAAGNLKPRLRMAVLYFFANRLGRLVVGSSNRCELGVGYFTKYGDGGVDISPLGNLVKSQVRDLARHVGVPREIIDKPPSAGLWEGQTDEEEMGLTYEQLDAYFTTGQVAPGVRRKIEERIGCQAHKRALPAIPPF